METALGSDDSDSSESKLKDIKEDVKTMKTMFEKLIGSTWSHAARSNTASRMLTGARARGKTPWEEYKAVGDRSGKDSNGAYVRKQLMTYAFRHEWKP